MRQSESRSIRGSTETRPIASADAGDVAQLIRNLLRRREDRTDPIPPPDEWEILSDIGARGKAKDMRPQVAVVDGKVVGFAAINIQDTTRTGRLVGPLVDPEYRRRGLGKRLMADVFEMAAAVKLRRLRACISDENVAGTTLVKANRFKAKERSTCLRIPRTVDIPELPEWRDLKVRRANYDHSDQVHDIVKESVERKPSQTRTLLKTGDYLILLAYQGPHVAGYAEVDLRYGEIANLELLDGQRRLLKRGLGNLLLAEAMRASFERPTVSHLELLIPGDDEKKQQTYLDAGFVRRCVFVDYERSL